ncbi:MAG: CRISPR-associated protein Cas4 [Leptotrichiaceae bacterium]|nr:CRISPR-associated protein Cas4 [Leptotrichiaceae bacterium]
MKINGTLINYYFHCKRQCWLCANRLNMEDESEEVRIGKVIHENMAMDNENSELNVENIKIDKITKEYLVEIKKSDADVQAVKWQVLLYLKILKEKGVERKGKIEFVEKNKQNNKIIYLELTEELEKELELLIEEIENYIHEKNPSGVLNDKKCNKCSYYSYCYI